MNQHAGIEPTGTKPTGPQPIGISAENLAVRRDGREVIAGLSLHLPERRVGLVGRNGSGKSTLARLIKGLLIPDAGNIRVFGHDPAARNAEAMSAVGFLFQNSDHQILCPTVIEEIAFGPLEMGVTRAEAETHARDLLARHNATDWAERPVATLSEGQRRLVCIFAVLATSPRLIVLDEPYAGLDIPTRIRLARFLDGLPQHLVMIAHDAEAFAGYDRLIWLESGAVRDDGPPDRVMPAFTAAMHRLAEPGPEDTP